MAVGSDRDDKGFAADHFGIAGVGESRGVPFHIGEVAVSLHDVAIGGEELRVVLFAMQRVGEGLLWQQGLFDFPSAGDFTNETIVPEVVEIIASSGVEAEGACIGLVARERRRDGLWRVLVVAEEELLPIVIDAIGVNGGIGATGDEHINRAERLRATEDWIEASEVVLFFGRHAAEGRAEFEATGYQSDLAEHGAAGVGVYFFERFPIGVVAENAAVLVPTQADARSHFRLEMRGIEPYALEVNDARGDVKHGRAVLAEIAFVDEGAFTEAFAGEFEYFAIGGGGGVVAVFEAAVLAPGGFGVVEFDADESLLADAFPHGEGVGLEAGIGEIHFYEGHVVWVLGVNAGDVVVEHPFRVSDGEVVRGHVTLDVGEGDASEFGDFAAEFSEGFVGGNEVAVFGPGFIVPPTLLGIAGILIAVVIGLEADGHGCVAEDAGFRSDFHLADEFFGIVERSTFAIRTLGNEPTAEGGEIVGLGPSVVGMAKSHSISFERSEGIRGGGIEKNGIGGVVGAAGSDEFSLRIFDGDRELALAFVKADVAEKLVVMQSADDKRTTLVVDFSGDEKVVMGANVERGLDAIGFGASTAAEELGLGEGLTGVEACFIDDADASDAGGKGAVIGDRESQHGVGDFFVESEVEGLDEEVAAGGCFGDGKTFSCADGVFDISSSPGACRAHGLLPSCFIDAETSPCDRRDIGDKIGGRIRAGLEIVGETHGFVGDGDPWFCMGDLDSVKRSEEEREEEYELIHLRMCGVTYVRITVAPMVSSGVLMRLMIILSMRC